MGCLSAIFFADEYRLWKIRTLTINPAFGIKPLIVPAYLSFSCPGLLQYPFLNPALSSNRFIIALSNYFSLIFRVCHG